MKLFERTAIGSMKLKNRIIMSPMGTSSDVDGGFSTQSKDYYVERAKGGFGLIILACNIATDKYETRPNNMLDNFHKVGRLEALIDECHQYGAKVCVQISPGCGRMGYSDPNTPPYAASAVPSCWFPDLICKPFSVEQIHDLVKKVGYTAFLAKTAGADAVEFQGYGGYLIDQFMTSLWNNRTDEYGGSLENRMRFPLEMIEEVKKTCGNSFPIIFKFTVTHEIPEGKPVQEGLKIAKILEQAGVAALHVDHGSYEQYYYQITTVYNREASKVHLAEMVKKEVNIPVFCDGKLGDPEIAESVLQEGKTDFIALGKQAIADPDWPNKVKSGRYDEIRSCIYCNECHLGMHQGKYLMCAVNPYCGHEKDYFLTAANNPKKLLVIGGGPGGMECAVDAAERGHAVELWEQRSVLGGNLRAAAAPEFKKDVQKYLDYLIGRLKRSSVKVELSKRASADEIIAYDADMVVLAVGAKPFYPPIPGIIGSSTKIAYDVLTEKESVGKRIAVIGGGLVGCETALMLDKKGKEVTIIEMMDRLIPGEVLNRNNEQMLKRLLSESNIKICLGTQLCEVKEDRCIISCQGTKEELLCDNVVLACGFKPEDSLEMQLLDKVKELKVIGDCVSPRKVYTAVHEGFHAARLL
ncbi:MAG: FAD-dependent oxidoreductase [Lutisporaceae bacterium]|jgi:2-enoate reductase